MAEPWLRINILADEDAPFVVMFEPTGMTYDLKAGDKMSADISQLIVAELQIIHWKGGISIWAPGPIITRDVDGNELHRLN
jgi:hypothetical protein